MPKTGSNEPCHCNSTKKYKKCCMVNDYNVAHSFTPIDPKVGDTVWSDNLMKLSDHFKSNYDLVSLNMTCKMTIDNEKAIYQANANREVILLLEKTPENIPLFTKRGDHDSDTMVSYKAHYQYFNYATEYNEALIRIREIIEPKSKRH